MIGIYWRSSRFLPDFARGYHSSSYNRDAHSVTFPRRTASRQAAHAQRHAARARDGLRTREADKEKAAWLPSRLPGVDRDRRPILPCDVTHRRACGVDRSAHISTNASDGIGASRHRHDDGKGGDGDGSTTAHEISPGYELRTAMRRSVRGSRRASGKPGFHVLRTKRGFRARDRSCRFRRSRVATMCGRDRTTPRSGSPHHGNDVPPEKDDA